MTPRIALAAAAALLLPSLACNSAKTYPVTFVCEPSSGADCPSGSACPVVPAGDSACGDLPGLFGHPSTTIDMARPVGCLVGLPYGNPNFEDSQQTCTCQVQAPGTPASWWCPI